MLSRECVSAEVGGSLKKNQNVSGKQGGKREGAGRKKGGQNKSTAEIKEIVDAIFKKVNPVEKAIKLLEFGGDKTQAMMLLKLWEYRYGKPVQPIGPVEGGGQFEYTIRFGGGSAETEER
jgi:hypothetical protein